MILRWPFAVASLSCAMLLSAACSADAREQTAVGVMPNDPHYAQQAWYLNAVHVPEAWSVTTGSSNIVVAVVDSGKVNHPELNGKWVAGGYNFWEVNSDPTEPLPSPNPPNASWYKWYPHGSHVAGIIGATAAGMVNA